MASNTADVYHSPSRNVDPQLLKSGDTVEKSLICLYSYFKGLSCRRGNFEVFQAIYQQTI
jgi:hypothetical protein